MRLRSYAENPGEISRKAITAAAVPSRRRRTVKGPAVGDGDRRALRFGGRVVGSGPGYPPDPLHVAGSGSGATGSVRKFTRSSDESTTVTPSGKLRF